MSVSMLVIMGISTLQAVVTILYITYYRKWVTKMNGMIVSMALGMTMGILIGTILGAIFHGDLFTSTFYSILIGLTIGFISGLPSGLPAVIDGMLSGLMGGMMGAMLGDMIAITKPDTTIKLLAYIVTMILLLVLYTAERSIQEQSKQAVFSFFKYPFLLIFLISLVYFGLHNVDPIVIDKCMK